MLDVVRDGVEDSLDQCNDTEYWNGETLNSNGCQDNQPTTPIQALISTPSTQTPVSNLTSAPVGNIVEYEAEYATWDTSSLLVQHLPLLHLLVLHL